MGESRELNASYHGHMDSPATRLARPADLEGIWNLYAEVTNHMSGTPGDVGWELGSHPSAAQLERAISTDTLIIAEPSPDTAPPPDTASSPDTAPSPDAAPSPAGAVIVDTLAPAGYGDIPWETRAEPGEYAVVHLLAVSPLARGLGLARVLLDASARLAADRGMRALRLDVFDTASHAIQVYRACGFRDLGLHELDYTTCDHTTFRIFERPL